MNQVISFLIKDGITYILYLILMISIYHLIMAINERELTGRRARQKVKNRLRKQVIEKRAEEFKNESQTLSKLELMLRSTSKDPNKKPSVFGFVLFCVILGSSTFFLIFSRLGDFIIASVLGLLISYIPYLFLLVRFNRQKSSFSNNITHVIEILIHHYSSSGHDMYKAVKGVAKEVKDVRYRRLFMQIASAMHLRHEPEIVEAIDVLTFSIGGTWAKRLGSIILTGYIRSDSVMKALVHLSNDAQKSEKMLKEEKSASFNTVVTAYLTIPFMLGTLMINRYLTRAFDYTDIQFNNPIALFLLVVTLAMIAISIIVALYIRNPKNDL